MREPYLILLAILCAVIGACDKAKPVTPPVQAGTRVIQIKTWVILGSSPQEVIGRRENAGCRLTQAEMTAYIQHTGPPPNNHPGGLRAHANFFGNGTTFAWSGQFHVINFTNLIIFTTAGNRRRTANAYEEEVFDLQNKWDPDVVNIYFAGWIDYDESLSSQEQQFGLPAAAAFTADPSQFSTPYILINDGGPYNLTGWQDRSDERILEHEMTHFLGRFSGDTFGPYTINGQQTSLTYNNEEHTPTVPADWKLVNILWGGDPLYYVKIGRRERQEIVTRVFNGNWLNP